MPRNIRSSGLTGITLVVASLLAATFATVASATSSKATAVMQLPTDASGFSAHLSTAFLPNGQLLALAPENKQLIIMQADGTAQSILATIDAPNVTGALAFDASRNLILGASVGSNSSSLYAFTPSGQAAGSVDVSNLVRQVNSIQVTPQGDVLIAGDFVNNDPTSNHGLYRLSLTYNSGANPSLTVNSSTVIYSSAVTGVAVGSDGTIYACTRGDLVSMASDGSSVETISGNRACRAPIVAGSTLYDAAPSVTQLAADNLQSVSLITKQTTVLQTMSTIIMRPWITGLFWDISVNPSNVVGATPGGLTLSEENAQPIPISISDEFLPTLYSADATGGKAKVIAVGSQRNSNRFVNVVANQTTHDFYITDQFGGRILAMSPDGTNQRVVVSNFRSPGGGDLHHVGTYPAIVAADPTHKYLFVLDGTNISTIRRFPIAGAEFSNSIPKLATRSTPTVHGSSGTLYATSIAVNGSLVYLGFSNAVYSETETGSAPKTVLSLPTGTTINFIATGADKNIYVGAHGSTNSIVVLSPAGKTLRTIKLGTSANPAVITADNANHVFFIDQFGGLNEVAATGVGGVRHIMDGAFTGVAANSNGTIMLLTRTEVDATTATRLLS